MIDAHCHLNFKGFEQDYDLVIKNARLAGIKKIINVGTQLSSSRWAVDLADKYEDLYAAVAIHPHHADKLTTGHPEERSDVRILSKNWLTQLEKIARHPKVVAIGECGLDYFNYQSNGVVDPAVQKNIFISQLELASKLKLPLQIHSRVEAARLDIIEILNSHKSLLQKVPGMFHCMAGSIESAKKILDLGFYLGFDGNITYPGNPPGEPLPLSELIKYAPLDRIIIESDSPYLAPLPRRGTRNEPKYAIITAGHIAQLKKLKLEKVIEQTGQNVYTIFTKLKS